jgi:hypothetical protein
LKIAACYTENESGAKLARPELFRLLADSEPGDILLIEQVDRLSRLTAADWERLKTELTVANSEPSATPAFISLRCHRPKPSASIGRLPWNA